MPRDSFHPMTVDEFVARVAAWQREDGPHTLALHRYLGYSDREYPEYVAMVRGYHERGEIGWPPVGGAELT